MNMATLFQVAKFLFANWSTIRSLIAELMKLFNNDTAKVKECLDGLCEVAQQKQQPAGQEKIAKIANSNGSGKKRTSLLGRLLGRR